MIRPVAFGLVVVGALVSAKPIAVAAPLASPSLFPLPTGTYNVSGLAVIVESRPVNGKCSASPDPVGITSYHQIKGQIVLEGGALGYSDFEDTETVPGSNGTSVSSTLSLGCAVGYGVSDNYDLQVQNFCYYAARDGSKLNLDFLLNLEGSLPGSQMLLHGVPAANGLPQPVLVTSNDQPVECLTPTAVILTGSK